MRVRADRKEMEIPNNAVKLSEHKKEAKYPIN